MYFVMKMAKQFSKKTAIFSLLGIAATLLMGACLQPPNIDDFIRDDDVQDIVSRGLVNLIDLTENENLVAGNRRITGLSANGYYLVEVLDEDEESLGYRFVSANGILTTLDMIGNVNGGAIVGLNNDYTYIVKNAVALTGIVQYLLNLNAAPVSGITITQGKINVPRPEGQHFLNFYDILPVTGNYAYDVLRIHVSPSSPPPHSYILTHIDNELLAIELPGNASISDYIFFAEDPDDYSFDRFRFRVLRVEVKAPEMLEIILTLEIDDYSPAVTNLDFDRSIPRPPAAWIITFNIGNY